jgi:protease-4
MERNRKILLAILAMLALSSVVSVFDLSLNVKRKSSAPAASYGIPTGPGIGIVRVDGPITFGVTKGFIGDVQGAESIISRLDQYEKNSDIKAIVIRINSPGGSVSATQEIYQKILKIRKKNIPIIASMGEIAASGGYYIASACDMIIANQGTITGSIGVIAASPNFKVLFDKLGIKMNVIKSGKYKDMLSSYRDLPADELALVQDIVDSSYRQFLKDVALGRNMNQSDIAPYADGRVFTGEKGLEYKLIDMTGTFEDALAKARERAGLDESAPVYDIKPGSIESLLRNISSSIFARGSFMPTGIEEHLSPSGFNLPVEYRYER